MAFGRIGANPSVEAIDLRFPSINSLTLLLKPVFSRPILRPFDQLLRRSSKKCVKMTCKASKSIASDENDKMGGLSTVDDELGLVNKFEMSDFEVSDRVSIGLGGRGDELVFEALVKNPDSPLYNTRVVLRELTSVQAQRRGKRAIEVFKKLVRRRLLYLSYSMQVHGYVSSSTSDNHAEFTLVHGYHGSFSLRHWLQQSDWLPTLEATLALDEESVRKVGDDSIGGPAVSRKLRLIRLLMRDLLIGVNYLHSHGLAHTELRLENLHVSPVDRHIKVGFLGNAVDFIENTSNSKVFNSKRRQMMIAFDMRCVGFIMAKMVLPELMDPVIFAEFKSFLTKGNDPSCLREFMLPILCKNSPSGSIGLQILDRNWGAGWNLLALLLAPKPFDRISCLDALRHPFLCGPRWRVQPSMNVIRWGLGSTAVRITEEYIYRQPQRNRLSYFVELMEMLNPYPKPKNWLELLPGKWRLLYCTGRHIGLTLRQPAHRVLIGDVHLIVDKISSPKTTFKFTSDIAFNVITGQDWPHDKTGTPGNLKVMSPSRLRAGRRQYIKKENSEMSFSTSSSATSVVKISSSRKWKKAFPYKEIPSSLPVAKLASSEIELTMNLGEPLSNNVDDAKHVLKEVRLQVPPEMFDLSKVVCGTYVDSRLLVLRSVNGSALIFTRSCR
ncbi:probable plastid-lipid-associated protein 14, chloroplastic [Chenopodium quinoa]|uniref:probable plastid-lipid-associated protein 14, chloroplastic n=1 Tax=Chenopodium quinoa TaxID=63459 RepID=UPI000B7911B3|nr:probable plastid-lipid-associated protein 14, chloroplastic [Chenopodium quinoa]